MQSTESEIWRPIPGYEGIYEVSNLGAVRSVDRRDSKGSHRCGRVLKGNVSPKGYILVSLSRDGKSRRFRVHHLVLRAFIGPRPEGMEACHSDGNPAHNSASNLRWDTSANNKLDTLKHGNHRQANKTHCPRGHALAEPNLIPAQILRGWRGCLACARASDFARGHGIEVTQELTDRYYDQLCASPMDLQGAA